MSDNQVPDTYLRKPEWLRTSIPHGDSYKKVKSVKEGNKLATVCEEANCPNMCECWQNKHATFMILGKKCSRSCLFCSVDNLNSKSNPDENEPEKIAFAVKELGLKYCVITSVTRDDIEDGGVCQFVQTIEQIKNVNEDVIIELLIPDFLGKKEILRKIADSGAQVIGHNIETSRKLHAKIRPQADYGRSLEVLKRLKDYSDSIVTKSSFMVGLGENDSDICEMFSDLKNSNVDIVYIGQYLKPSKDCINVERYVSLEKFDEYKLLGEKLGIAVVVSGPLVRSSYKAENSYKAFIQKKNSLGF
ncbi:MAG: hypothetical protein ACD_79C00494G0007 [uncultured bacterium]|nr:MAG: hypothetical protein ACD_79C00494G0007 [uncultured bacterium]